MPSQDRTRQYVVYGLVETRMDHRFQGMIRYVGQTDDLTRRVGTYRKGRGHSPHLNAWLNACPDFDVRQLYSTFSKEDVLTWEVSMISKFNTYKSKHGLNFSPGGESSIFELHRRRALDPEFDVRWRARIGEASKKRVTTEIARKNMSIAQKARPPRVKKTRKPRPVPTTARGLAISRAKTGKPITETHRQALVEGQSRNRWKCHDCDFMSIGRWVEEHLKKTDHTAKERVA